MVLTEEEFSNWYNNAIERAELLDKRYPIKGMDVWTPYGWQTVLNLDNLLRSEFNKYAHEEVCFPLLITDEQFKKEREHIKGFDEQVYWVTHAGKRLLDVKLLLRPTSETAMYPVFALWIRSHADLPLKVFQIVNVFRYETKQTRTFIRVREIHFFEAHTCHCDEADAEKQIEEDLEIMQNIAKKLCLPYIAVMRPSWDKFAGAYYSIAADTPMPTGRTLQIAGIHQYLENFARAFDIKYEGKDGEHRYVHQTTFGLSERLLGAIIGVHGDTRGIILPPAIAPYQIVVVPIFTKESQKKIMNACNQIAHNLQNAGIRVIVDCRDLRPGNKYYYWEAKGVPLRIEIGLRELNDDTLTIVRRDTFERSTFKCDKMIEHINTVLEKIETNLYERALADMWNNIKKVKSVEDASKVSGILKTGWCGSEDCGRTIEETTGLNLLGTSKMVEKDKFRCAVCGKSDASIVYIAKSY